MAKEKKAGKKENIKANRISKTTIVLYIVVIAISAAFLSIMGASQTGAGGGCCDCSQCSTCCCCDSCSDSCQKDIGCVSAQMEDVMVEDPYTGDAITASDYFCRYGSIPPEPEEGECDENEKQDCPLQQGVCSGSQEVCTLDTPGVTTSGYWPGCTATSYRTYAESMGYKYEVDEMLCDKQDNDCDGEKDEGCDGDTDNYCSKEMECAGGKFNCGKAAPGIAIDSDECSDCDDSNPLVYPNAEEVCDGIDNNCNNRVDEGCECTPIGSEEACEKQLGLCAGTKRTCKSCADMEECEEGQTSGWEGCGYAKIDGYRSVETGSFYCADTVDNDCDGKTDCEDPGCLPFCAPPVP